MPAPFLIKNRQVFEGGDGERLGEWLVSQLVGVVSPVGGRHIETLTGFGIDPTCILGEMCSHPLIKIRRNNENGSKANASGDALDSKREKREILSSFFTSNGKRVKIIETGTNTKCVMK